MKKRNQTVSLGILIFALSACATQPDSSLPPFKTRGAEQVFATPDQAAAMLIDADRRNDKAALLKILGPNGANIISSGDPVADRENHARMVAAYTQSHHFENGADNNRKVLIIGEEEWPLPIPIVQVAPNEWQFDTEAGEQEILNRRVGRNEISAIKTCRAYVEAQREYAIRHPAPEGKPEFAQRFVSHPGKHDGLYWPTRAGEEESPFGPLIADAKVESAGKLKHYSRHPHHGYYYKILKQQGTSAAGGKEDYIVNGHMTGGFALIAFPAKYGDSGVMTFIVNRNGIVFEKNLGPDTAILAPRIMQFDPDNSWKIVRD